MPSLPTNPRDADAAIKGSRFASLEDAPFYGGSVNTGDGDTTNSVLINYNQYYNKLIATL